MQSDSIKIMVLGAGQIQVPIIKKCKSLGLRTIVVDYDSNAPGFQFADLCLHISTHDKNLILEHAKKLKINAITTTSDFPVNVVAHIAEVLNLHGLNAKAAAISTNKYLLRESLKTSELKFPEYFLIRNESELSSINSFPLVMKPVDASASRGVIKINSKKELLEEYQNSLVYSNSKQIILEEFIEGQEFSVESITTNGKTKIIAITEKILVENDNGFFVEDAHIVPASINSLTESLIETTVRSAINHISLDNSASHTELIINKEGAYIIEIGARLGGDFIGSHLVQLSTGIDMLNQVINISLGKEIDVNHKIKLVSGIQFITPSNYFSAQKFISSENKHIAKFEIQPFEIKAIKNSLDRLGFIIIGANSRQELNKLFKQINYGN